MTYGAYRATIGALANCPPPLSEEELEAGRIAHALDLPTLRGVSQRLLDHRLSTYDAERAKAQGPQFMALWEAHRAGKGQASARGSGVAPKQAKTVIAPSAAARVAAAPVVPPAMTAEQRAALKALSDQQAAAVEARRKAAEQLAAQKREAEIAESWRQAHARVAAQWGNRPTEQAEDPKANHGWAAIHAAIRQRRGY